MKIALLKSKKNSITMQRNYYDGDGKRINKQNYVILTTNH